MSPARGDTNSIRFRRSSRVLRRLKTPTYDLDELRDAITKAADWDSDGWAHTRLVAQELGVSIPTAYRRLCDAASRGWIESREMYRWWFTKSVLSRHWKARRMFAPKADPEPAAVNMPYPEVKE